jgi:peptidoglycan/xylan/chitin deacetylase (PgdA/CDA1 family)
LSLAIATFCFHEVTDDPESTGFQRRGAVPFRLTPAGFSRHLDRIGAAGASPRLVTQLGTADRHILLTFDDGGRSALTAADELERRGWRGHFFIVTSRIGTRTFLAREDIRELHRRGHVIGGHSHTHPDIFRELPVERMRAEWRTSADLLSDLLGEPCETASVPGGEISTAVLQSASDTGFRFVFTVEPVLRPWHVGQCMVLGRFLVKAATEPSRVDQLARFRGWGSALAVRRLKAVARRTVPPLYRYVIARRAQESC